MEKLNYKVTTINRFFKIKVEGNYEGNYIKTLVGVSGLVRIINDISLTNRLLDRAFNSRGQKCVCKLRRQIVVSFYNY